MPRKWLVEETGEVRVVQPGEHFEPRIYDCYNVGLRLSCWPQDIECKVSLPIFRVTELTSPTDNFDEWNW